MVAQASQHAAALAACCVANSFSTVSVPADVEQPEQAVARSVITPMIPMHHILVSDFCCWVFGGDNMQMRARVTPTRQSAAMILMAAAMLLQGIVAIDK